MMIIKDIKWVSEEALEAEVIVTDGHFELLCFSQPFKKNKGDQLSEPIYALDPYEILKLETKSSITKKLNGTYDYLIEGKLINKESGHVRIGDLIIEIDGHFIPRDIIDDNNISFKCTRLDIY